MNRHRLLRILGIVALLLAALALAFYVPAKGLVASIGLPPTLVLLGLAVVALVLLIRL
jgi:hypothetical protein